MNKPAPIVSPAAELSVSNSKITNSSADDKVEEVSMATDALPLRTSKRKADFVDGDDDGDDDYVPLCCASRTAAPLILTLPIRLRPR
jgi:hypothetical protein